MIETLDVFKLDTSIVSKLSHPLNIPDISTTEDVSKLERSTDFNFVHPANISAILTTFCVFNFDNPTISSRFIQPLNIPEVSVGIVLISDTSMKVIKLAAPKK